MEDFSNILIYDLVLIMIMILRLRINVARSRRNPIEISRWDQIQVLKPEYSFRLDRYNICALNTDIHY